MTPPEAQGDRQSAEAPAAPPAVSVCPDAVAPSPRKPSPIPVIPIRADFLKAASARRQSAGSFLLQARDRRDGDATLRMGFTASKKVGNAVARNRAKRRLREVARMALPALGQPGWDYVLVARPDGTIARPFADLLRDLETALRQVHRPRPPKAEGGQA